MLGKDKHFNLDVVLLIIDCFNKYGEEVIGKRLETASSQVTCRKREKTEGLNNTPRHGVSIVDRRYNHRKQRNMPRLLRCLRFN